MQPTAEDYAFVTSYTPVPLANAVAMLRSRLRRQVFSALISIVVSVVLWIVIKDKSTFFRVLMIGSAAFSVLLTIVLALRLWRARRMLAKLETGPALRIDPLGLVLATPGGFERLRWSEVHRIGAKPRGKLPGPELVVHRGDKKQWRIPFMYLDVMPGSIDSAIRAHTSGRMVLDLAKLDRII